MSWVPAEQVLGTVNQQRELLAHEQARIATFQQYHTTERQKLEAEYAQAVHDLGQALLPSLEPRAIAAAAQVTGLTDCRARHTAKLEGRRAWLAARTRMPRATHVRAARAPPPSQHGSLRGRIAEAGASAADPARPRHDVRGAPAFRPALGPASGRQRQRVVVALQLWEDRSSAQALSRLSPARRSSHEVRAGTCARRRTSRSTTPRSPVSAPSSRPVRRSPRARRARDEHRNLDARGLAHTRGRIVQPPELRRSLVSQRLQPGPRPVALPARERHRVEDLPISTGSSERTSRDAEGARRPEGEARQRRDAHARAAGPRCRGQVPDLRP